MSEKTRVDRVLRDLRSVGAWGFCARRWYIEDRPNDRNAPSEINALPGYEVHSEPCHEPDHPPKKKYARHFLVRDPKRRPEQLAWQAA